jgi:hypothetical protein
MAMPRFQTAITGYFLSSATFEIGLNSEDELGLNSEEMRSL